jgi:integrase
VRTVNKHLATLSCILRSYADDYQLERSPVDRLKPLSEAEYPVYTEEEPNALLVEHEAAAFAAELLARYPHFYAMVALGFATGLRPSSLRPLRRQGPTPDLLWDEGYLLVRRSHTRGEEIMNTTKTGKLQKILLAPEILDILRWHVEHLPPGPQRDSELLFPACDGGLWCSASLQRPFRKVAQSIGLKKRITPRAMRRTFQDLARKAQMDPLVTRSISGHLTEVMQHHYSTVQAAEQRDGMAKVIALSGLKTALKSGGESGGKASEPGADKEPSSTKKD